MLHLSTAKFDIEAAAGAVGKPIQMALIHVAATSEAQTANTMRMVRVMASKRSALAKKYKLNVGKTYVEQPETGVKLEQIASSEGSAEGFEITFAVCDETEHWTPGQGGPGLMRAIKDNAAKSDNRILETSNSWEPGAGSIAEETFDAWVVQQEGKTRGKKGILYDSIQAPPHTSLTDNPKPGEISLLDALAYVYQDCAWINTENIAEQIWQPNSDPALSRRFYLNQSVARTGAWVSPQQWATLADPKRELEPGEEIVLFFDGSKSNDHTALVGCCMEDGHVFTVGVWKPEEQLDGTKEVDVHAVDEAVQMMRETYSVVGFWADVREFESYVKTKWPQDFEDEALLPAGKSGKPSDLIAWDMRSKENPFAMAVEMTYDEIQNGEFTHDGHPVTSEHIANAVVREHRNGRISIRKESAKSARKIDAAVCAIGARMVYRAVKESPSYQKRNHYYTGGWVL
ncbi:terminase [Corynebacterium genitalium]|nr:terminase [Corynebacterium genitalium]